MRRVLTSTLALGGLVAAGLAAATPAGADADPPEQWRSYWVDAFNEGIYNADQVSDLVDAAVDINANALIVQTSRRYDCFCNDSNYPRTHAGIDPLPYDPLAEMIEQAHAAGLEVHAWVNVNTMWNQAAPPPSPDHAFNNHGPTAEGRDRWLNKKFNGQELQGNNAFVDPGHPDVRDYIVDGIQSIVANYDVDGINLDYVRYPDFNSSTTHSDWGYNDTSIERFQAATGRDDVPEPSDEQFTQWRRDQVTALVNKIYLGMWEVDPTARLSMDAITYGHGPRAVGGWEATRTYAEVLQDWRGWLEDGIMDTAVTMNYKRNWLAPQDDMFDEWSEFLADNQGQRQAVNGPALYLNSVEDALEQAIIASTPTAAGNVAAGWSGYSYANPSMEATTVPFNERTAERDALAALLTGEGGPFAEEAAVPAMPWKENPTDGHVTGTLVFDTGSPLDQVEVTLRPLVGGSPASTLADGSGWFGIAHVDTGRYLVEVDLPSGVVGQPVGYVRIKAGEITEAKFAPYVQLP
jgi:uncharacterized lipoprotein YddW (UPF0748 family)